MACVQTHRKYEPTKLKKGLPRSKFDYRWAHRRQERGVRMSLVYRDERKRTGETRSEADRRRWMEKYGKCADAQSKVKAKPKSTAKLGKAIEPPKLTKVTLRKPKKTTTSRSRRSTSSRAGA